MSYHTVEMAAEQRTGIEVAIRDGGWLEIAEKHVRARNALFFFPFFFFQRFSRVRRAGIRRA